MTTFLIIFGVVGLWVFGFFVGRNNPTLKAVDKLIAAGKIVKDSTGKIITVIKAK